MQLAQAGHHHQQHHHHQTIEDHGLPRSVIKTFHVTCSGGRLGKIRYDTRTEPTRMCVSVTDGSRAQSCVDVTQQQAPGHVNVLGGVGVSVNTVQPWMAVVLQCLQQFMLRAWLLLWALVMGIAFVIPASAQTTETKGLTPKMADWVYRRPPNDVPLRVGVLPPEALSGATVCNRIWLDQGGSYERPFAITYSSDNKFSKTVFFPGIFALDDYILRAHNGFQRETLAKYMGKGDRGFVNAGEEAVLVIDQEGEEFVGNHYFALYLKRISSEKSPAYTARIFFKPRR